jgi:hypothetical protein
VIRYLVQFKNLQQNAEILTVVININGGHDTGSRVSNDRLMIRVREQGNIITSKL